MHFRVKGKGDKTRFVPVHPMAQRLIEEYLALGKHGRGAGWRGAGQFGLRRSPLPSREKQPHRDAGQASGTGFHLPQHRPEIRARDRNQL